MQKSTYRRLTCENAFGVKSDSAEFKAGTSIFIPDPNLRRRRSEVKRKRKKLSPFNIFYDVFSREACECAKMKTRKESETFIFTALGRRKRASDEIKEKSQILDVVIARSGVLYFQVIVSPSANDSREKSSDDGVTWLMSLQESCSIRNKRNFLFFCLHFYFFV